MFKRLFKSIQDFFTPPRRVFQDFYEETSYLLTYRMYIFLFFTLAILTVILFNYYDWLYTTMSLIGFISIVVCFLMMRKSDDYRQYSLIFNLLGAALCQGTLWGISNQLHLVDSLWMTINILFMFMTVGKNWGIFVSILHGVTFSVYYFIFFADQIPLIENLEKTQLAGIAINILLCFAIILYLSWQNIKINRYSHNHLQEAKATLQRQFDIINKQNEEKTMLLKEIHHRVKNNLQVITSLLRLQSRELENEEAIEKFKETTDRVIAMSMIHEKMYQSEELSKINLHDYLKSLADDLLHSYHLGFTVNVEINCGIKTIGMRPIVPLALIFNELFSNSLKYAFSPDKDAEVRVSLIEKGNTDFTFTYADNGTWREIKRKDSFGLELIDALTEQLEGTMEFESQPQTVYTFNFPNLDL